LSEKLTLDESKNAAVLHDFTQYCQVHPELRFWQALRNWALMGNFLLFSSNAKALEHDYTYDTYYWEGKNK